VGVIEPFVVHRQADGKYLLLDGHVRVIALKELGKEEEFCLVAKVTRPTRTITRSIEWRRFRRFA
jgi:ParB-like chromosome segregation protein Spo0J